MSINIGDKVKVPVESLDGSTKKNQTGIVLNIHRLTTCNLAIVKTDDGYVIKVPLEELTRIDDQKKPEVRNEIPKGSRMISESEFRDAVKKLTTTFNRSDNVLSEMILNMTVGIVGNEIADDMFKTEEIISFTKTTLIMAIWSGCNPERIWNSVNGEMPLYECLSVSIVSLEVLSKLVEVFFPEDESETFK